MKRAMKKLTSQLLALSIVVFGYSAYRSWDVLRFRNAHQTEGVVVSVGRLLGYRGRSRGVQFKYTNSQKMKAYTGETIFSLLGKRSYTEGQRVQVYYLNDVGNRAELADYCSLFWPYAAGISAAIAAGCFLAPMGLNAMKKD